MGRPKRKGADSDNAQSKGTLLLVDDEESVHDIVGRCISEYRFLSAYNGWQSLDALSKHHVDVVLLDLNLPDTTGLKLLDTIRADREDIEVIILTAHSELPNAVEAVKRGAFDFLPKTYENYRTLSQHVERALTHRRRRREQAESRTKQQWMRDAHQLLDHSLAPAMRKAMELARQVSDTPLTVLLEGESGVGKEIVASYIHSHSPRGGPFVAVNLAAVPATLLESHLFGHEKGAFTGATRANPGKFELADSGTLFLDEIGELDASAQVKLLRVLQEREVERVGASESAPVDVRVIAATNKNLATEVVNGRFREDLFYRLNVVRITIPPLRNRVEDLSDLVQLLAGKHSLIMRRDPPSFIPETIEFLQNYDWPGNVRELENLIMRLVAVNPGKTIVPDDIPPEYCLPTLNKLADRAARRDISRDKESRLYFLARDQFERYLVRYMVKRHGGNKRAAAEALGVSYSTVKEKTRQSTSNPVPEDS